MRKNTRWTGIVHVTSEGYRTTAEGEFAVIAKALAEDVHAEGLEKLLLRGLPSLPSDR